MTTDRAAPPTRYAAVVLAGGAARRMGGADKPGVPVGGRPMRDRVLDAVADAEPRVLVGPEPVEAYPVGVRTTREEPPGAGPVAAVAAGLVLIGPEVPVVALLAADLPLLTGEAVSALRRELTEGTADGVCFVDDDGRRQPLCGVWRVSSVRTALTAVADGRADGLVGASMRTLLAGLSVTELPWSGAGPPPWFDCDTDDDVRRAEEWVR